jgi:hypothetical protein
MPVLPIPETSLTDLTSYRRNTGLTGVLNQLDRLADLVNNKSEINCMTQGLHKELKHA